MDDPDEPVTFTIGVTSLRDLAEQKGWRHEVTETDERVIRPDGTVAVSVPRKIPPRPLYSGVPTVWMRSIRYHTYGGKPQPEGALYLAHEDQVENIEAVLKFAVREAAPLKARREPLSAAPASAEDAAAAPEPAPVSEERTAADPAPPPKTAIVPPVKTPARSAPAKVMTTRDMPTKKRKK